MKFDWTDERIEQLKILWIEGLSCADIARAFGDASGRNSVIGKVNRLGLAPRPRAGGKPRAKRVTPFRPPSVAIPELDQSEADSLPPDQSEFAVTFEELREPHCRWPIGDSPFQFCGAVKANDGPYCARHQRIAYRGIDARSVA